MLILLVDNGEPEGRALAETLAAEPDIEVDCVGSGPAALDRLGVRPYDAVVTDLHMEPMSGIELVRRIRAGNRTLPLIILTANATVDLAVDSMRAGATDFIPRPVNATAIGALVRHALGEVPRREELERLHIREPVRARTFIAGDHPHLDTVRSFAERVAAVPEARVLITGESGTGKSCLARAVHALSGGHKRFVEVACATLPPTLIESELFGHEKGAFTDARSLKRGLIEMAAGGTLFLDEIGALPFDMQAKLLVFLESRQIRRVGGTEPIPISARVIAAANEDLRLAVRAGRFRSDLLYRLDVASVRMPTLREMPEVIPQLAARFAIEVAEQFHRPAPVLVPEAAAALFRYAWPGNVRELRNAVERAMIFHDGGPLHVRPPQQPPELAPADGVTLPQGLTLEEVERRYLLASLQDYQGDLGALAAQLGISRKTLWEKRRRLGIAAAARPNGAVLPWRALPAASDRARGNVSECTKSCYEITHDGPAHLARAL